MQVQATDDRVRDFRQAMEAAIEAEWLRLLKDWVGTVREGQHADGIMDWRELTHPTISR